MFAASSLLGTVTHDSSQLPTGADFPSPLIRVRKIAICTTQREQSLAPDESSVVIGPFKIGRKSTLSFII